MFVLVTVFFELPVRKSFSLSDACRSKQIYFFSSMTSDKPSTVARLTNLLQALRQYCLSRRYAGGQLYPNVRSEHSITATSGRLAVEHFLMKYFSIALACSLLSVGAVQADQFVPLIINGKISNVNDPATHSYRFSQAELMSMASATIVTSTNWTKRESFSGPLLSALLKRVGAAGSTLSVCAVDDYCHDVPVADAEKYGVILALTADGKPLPPSTFGPAWLIYPRDKYPGELNTATYDARFVWQVTRITVK
ncbi:molybdopterin-dependent oxidoreductase [Paraburkholderia sp. IMGN_8]|uniref:molybdopterin-dependent oxidoreductase n=1 Tax=Paraburkholderia sp. IMGN_8 TaxID=3136564 RepID=UPI0031018CA6